jgi:D-alanyl-lipoteichoic acid acyltransferase DltB (MBOAT superfamily)
MLFNSFSYLLVFLPLVLLSVFAARRLGGAAWAQAAVLVFSLFFYGFNKPSNLAYLIGSILVNWQLGRWIGANSAPKRKRVLQFGLALDIGFLSIFKYANFFLAGLPWLSRSRLILPDLEFPLGISFFTITQITYLVNCYEDAVSPSTFFDYATFVSFFPYVISGPISRAKRIIQQFPNLGGAPGHRSANLARGLYLFSLGLFKKVVFAYAFAQAADFGFTSATNLSTVEGWFFVSCYALQIYFDFSGYSDMAIGSALLLGIHLPPNFDSPFHAKSIIEFWQRWHISLTSFITNYLYTPIVRAFPARTWVTTSAATLAAMTLAGLWHGPSWGFIVFGALHGAALAINQNWRRVKAFKLPGPFSWLITMMVVDIAFVFFRLSSLPLALRYTSHLFDLRHPLGFTNIRLMNGDGLPAAIFNLIQPAGFLTAILGHSSEARCRDFRPTYWNCAAAVALMLVAAIFLNSNISKPFVYFKF